MFHFQAALISELAPYRKAKADAEAAEPVEKRVRESFPQGMHVRTFAAPWPCYGLAVNRSETLIVAAEADARYFNIYSLPTFALDGTIDGGWDDSLRAPAIGCVYRVCFTPEDSILVADYNRGVHEFLSTGEPKRTIEVKYCFVVACSNDGRTIAADADSENVVLLEYASGTVIRTMAGIMIPCCLKFTPDDNRLLGTNYMMTNVLMWSVADGALVRTVCEGLPSEFAKDIAITDSGDIIVTDGGNNRVCVFTPDGLQLTRQFGTKGTVDGEFKEPFTLAIANGHLYVADRGSKRVQVFQ